MLLTDNAVLAISTATGSGPWTGLRITAELTDDDRVRLALVWAPAPEPGDEIVEERGASVFLADEVARLLDGRTLDGDVTGEGRPVFRLLPAGERAATR